MTGSTEANARILVGECYCRAVRYEVADAFRYALNCHCPDCRRTTGSAFKPFAGIEREKLRVVAGADDLLIYGGETNHNAHCRHCGSLLYSLVRDGVFVHVTMGTLVDAPTIRPTAHIFAGSKAPWHEITDGLPQYQGHVTKT
ncbi:GFA family protein [Bradyrhizobium jicamae]|uniref:GFA family protein n=1 Tax=Bradyrhizobium jicamae TaxID=280332 RepID=UPI001BA76729|nr:GFA family protein [Bradyrhizobium jicamae]